MATRAPAGDELPPGWQKHVSRKTGKTYFFNTRTGKSVWSLADVHSASKPVRQAAAAPGAITAAKPSSNHHTPSSKTTTGAPARRMTPQEVEEEARQSRDKLQAHFDKIMAELAENEAETCLRVPAPDSMTQYQAYVVFMASTASELTVLALLVQHRCSGMRWVADAESGQGRRVHDCCVQRRDQAPGAHGERGVFGITLVAEESWVSQHRVVAGAGEIQRGQGRRNISRAVKRQPSHRSCACKQQGATRDRVSSWD